MKEIISTKHDLCTGCNRCVRECPMETANITYQDDDGSIKVKTDHDKCILCGHCISACKHNARDYTDDTERFFHDLANGVPISIIAAPSIKTNIPDYKNLFSYLKLLGVKNIYDVSLGADICVWAHIRYMEKTNFAPIITQPCPAIVIYCKIYHHDLLQSLSPVHSPMCCTSIYLKEYENITDRIAAISPCIAKSQEFEATGLVQYNVTFSRLSEYLHDKKIKLPENETNFSNAESHLGALFPMPGGLKENIEFYCGDKISIDRAEGYSVYKKLNAYVETPPNLLPQIFDALNCDDGCNIGTAGCNSRIEFFKINRTMDKSRNEALAGRDREHFDEVFNSYDEKLKLSQFIREYKTIELSLKEITDMDVEEAFALLGKTDYDKQNIDCGACGSNTCYDMARKIALGVNIPLNCIVKTMEDAKKEHEENLAAHEQLILMEKQHELDIQNELQLAKLDLIVKATKIALWDMEINRDAPVNPANAFHYSDEFRYMLGFEDENDFPNVTSSWSDRLHPDDKQKNLDAFKRHIIDKTGETSYNVEYRLQVKSGEYRYFRSSGETIRDEDGNPLRVAGSLMDITDSKNRLIETQKLREEAEAANKAKSAFLSTMSHEIRTPMNAILGITEINLQNGNLDPQLRSAFEKIYTSGDMLLGIINDILDLSKIEAGKMELINDKYEIASLLSDTVQLNMMRIGSKQIEFELDINENVYMALLGDELRVKQILNNLLSNAFKYTEKGTVTMSITTELNKENPNKVNLVASISDTGQGMSKDQVAKLFDEYSRFNLEANRTTEGTGLGMAITRNLIHMMNGNIHVESEPGKGSVFTVSLLQGKVSDEILGKEIAENLHNFRSSSRAQMKRVQVSREPMPYGSVLIVDDVEINIYVARGLMMPYKLKIDSANSGFEAIEKISNGNTYDIVFMDHMMPEMDGIETTKNLRTIGYKEPIVALTANAVAGQAEIFLGNGFDDFISKPIDVRQLNHILNKLIRDKQPPEVIEAARHLAEDSANSGNDNSQQVNNAIFTEIFVRDVKKSLAALEIIKDKNGSYNDDDLRRFIIHVHGMKSALANFGKMDLSAHALKLETLGRDGDIKAITEEIPAFLDTLKKVIEEISPPEEEDNIEITDTGKKHLQEELQKIITACGNYDESTAEEIIIELRKKQWPADTKKLLSSISENLLHSDFDKAAETIKDYIVLNNSY